MSWPGEPPLRIALSRSETRLRRSLIALFTFTHDSSPHEHSASAALIFESTSRLKLAHASRSYGGLTKRAMPLPHVLDAASAALMHGELPPERADAAVGDLPMEVASFLTHGRTYFQIAKTTRRMTIHLTMRDKSMSPIVRPRSPPPRRSSRASRRTTPAARRASRACAAR